MKMFRARIINSNGKEKYKLFKSKKELEEFQTKMLNKGKSFSLKFWKTSA